MRYIRRDGNDTLVDVIAVSGFNIDDLHAIFAKNENFLIGHEQHSRYCDADVNWLSDTVLFCTVRSSRCKVM